MSVGGWSERVAVVRFQKGLHARAGLKFSDIANLFVAEVRVQHANGEIDGKAGAFGFITLGIPKDDQVVVRARGPDAEAALEALCEFIESGQDAT